jgi:PAS domain S-box-containing protein
VTAKNVTPIPPLTSLRLERDRFVALAFCWADVLVELDQEETILFAAGALEQLIGLSTPEITGMTFTDLIAPADRAPFKKAVSAGRKKNQMESDILRLKGPKGISRPLRYAGYRLHDLNGHYFVALRVAIVERQNNGFGNRARDEGTGLYEEETFADMVKDQLAASGADESTAMSLIMLPGYDELGARMAKTAEQELESTLGDCLRESSVGGDTAARIGTDRYSLVHRDTLDIDSLKSKIAAITQEADPLKQGTSVDTATIEIDTDGLGEDELSEVLQHTIHKFKNYSPEDGPLENLSMNLSDLANEAAGAVEALKTVIERGDFEVVFQPFLHVNSGGIHHYEAFARFPERCGQATPYEHITFAEATGAIVDFDLAMIRKVLAWLHDNALNDNRMRIAVNVSGQSIASLSFLAQLERTLKDNSWARGRILFEITESFRIIDLRAANSFVQKLRNQGYQVFIDEFGIDAASFEYLARLDVDLVKISGTTLIEARSSRTGKAFLNALVGLCRKLGVSTAVEKLETECDLDFVRKCEIQYVQGFLFGQPQADVSSARDNVPQSLFEDEPEEVPEARPAPAPRNSGKRLFS